MEPTNSREYIIARLIANTRRKLRKDNLVEISNQIRWLERDLGSLKKVSETIGISVDQISQFLSVEKLCPEVKKLVENNYFGDLFYLRLQWTIQWMPELYPDKQLDIIVDMMPHLYDIMNYITGLWPKNITCFGKAFIKKDLEDTAFILCEFPNNIITHS